MNETLGIIRRYLEQGILAKVGLGIVFLIILFAIFGPMFVRFGPTEQDLSIVLNAPDSRHLLGTDELGRDILARVAYGARNSLFIGIISVGMAMVMGVTIGLLAGYWRGILDRLIASLMDAMLAFPPLVLAIAISAALGPGYLSIMIAIGIVFTPFFGRLVRGVVLSVREMEYVLGARAIGTRDVKIILRHILPNIAAPIIIQVSLGLAYAILVEAGLSFLGVGLTPPAPSWGSMLRDGYGYMQMAPSMAISPGVAIFVTVLGFNFVGDGIRDALDPTQQRVFKETEQ
ncbi:MAG: ABC transporter permease [Candidatus Adiutricales bacterium]